MNRKELATVAKATAREFVRDDVGYMAAALTYYVFFSIFPLLLLGVTLVSLFVQRQDAESFIFGNLGRVLPGSVQLVKSVVDEAFTHRSSVGIVAIIGLVTLIFAGSGAFESLDKAINRAWGSEKAPGMIAAKVTSFAMMLILSAILLLSFVLSAILTAIQSATKELTGGYPGSQVFWQSVNTAASFALVFLVLLLLYRFVPRCHVGVRDVWLAALLAAIVWTIFKELFAFYLGSSLANFSAVYGTLGAVVALLTGIYLSSLIILVGAEFASETAFVRQMRLRVSGQAGDRHQAEEQKPSPWFS